jgi:hypothetical protein
MSSLPEGGSRVVNPGFKATSHLLPTSDYPFGMRDLSLESDFFFFPLLHSTIPFPFSEAEESSKIRAPAIMKKFEDSEKAKKPARSMIETRGEKPKEKSKNSKKKGARKEGVFELLGHTRA